jgi:superfamily II DNA or RNA helicase
MVRSPRAGDLVRVRRRRWRVLDVRTYDDCQVVTLGGTAADDLGTERRVIAPFDAIEPIDRPPRLRLVTRARWRSACRALLANDTPPGSLRAGHVPHIDLLPHQLEPALAIVRGAGSRLLLADDVGLGKTIQAALVLSELQRRGAADRALILTPAGLRDQWTAELGARFDIHPTILDAREMRRRQAELPVGVKPWCTTAVAVASIDYVKRPEILASVASCHWDVLIVDEAHNVAGDSDRHAAVATLASRTAYALLLTATPHNGERRLFVSLCGLGAHGDRLLVFRRTRRDVRLGSGRRVHLLHVRPSAAERRMHALVATFGRAVLDDSGGDDKRREAVWLALAVLNKRALSSARSLQATIERRLNGLPLVAGDDSEQLSLPLADPEGEIDNADQPPDLAGLSLSDRRRERDLLEELARAARAAAERETKIAALGRLLRRVAEPAVVFTEYRDTLLHIERALGRPAAVLHGGLTRDQRSAALEQFTTGHRSVLLATDAAGEGLNLHRACRMVVNLELPWNPVRLEQRIGRVDRIGQRRRVHATHLVARDTAETRVLDRLRDRVARAQADVGAADPVDAADERAVARLIVLGTDDSGADTRGSASDSPAAPDVSIVAMKAAGEAEAARLNEVRRLTALRFRRRPTLVEPEGLWLTFVRNGATRMALRSNILLILRTGYEDACGRVLESTLVPLAMPWPRARLDRAALDELLNLAAPAVMARAELATVSWSERAATIARAFLRTRLARARAIAALVDTTPDTFQPGLFDRRAERRHLVDGALGSEAAGEAARRAAALESASQLARRPPTLVLVLAP